MQLTRTERWVLSNQYRILEALYPDEANHFARIRHVLEYGFELNYDWDIEHIYDDTMTADECREVIEILNMFRMLKAAYRDLPEKPHVDERHIKFAGFDGNDETRQFSYTQYLCGIEGKWQELDKGDDYNSHSPMLGRYRRQLAAWQSSADKYELTREDVERIVTAALFPK